jgi:hypothetical protein
MNPKRNQPAPSSKNQDRPRGQTQHQHGRRNNHVQPQYIPQETYSHHPPPKVYNYHQEEDINSQYQSGIDEYPRRLPSARISEIDSQEGAYMINQDEYPMEVYDEDGEYIESGKALVKHTRSESRQSDRSVVSQGYSQGQGYDDVSYLILKTKRLS